MTGRALDAAVFGALAVLCLAAAVAYRALSWASPARLEEINDEQRRYAALPDLEGAIVISGALKLFLYTVFILRIGSVYMLDGRAQGLIRGAAAAAAATLGMEAVALVAAGYHSGRTLYRILPVVAALSAPGAAVLAAGEKAAALVARALGRDTPPPADEAAEEEMLDAVIEGERDGVIEDQERSMIESIIEFKDSSVAEIMTPRTDLTIVTEDMPLVRAIDVAVESGHSRLPVAAQNADNIVGVLHVKDILAYVREPEMLARPVRDTMRAPYFVPETKRVRELLQEFRATNIHMAVVLDEYGGTGGIVTIEDILEEIVGEIEDEYDEYRPPEIRVLGPARAMVAATAPVGEVNDALGTEIPEREEYATIAGFVLYHVGRIPEPGETLDLEGLRFRIVEADQRRIKRMAVTVLAESAGAAGERTQDAH